MKKYIKYFLLINFIIIFILSIESIKSQFVYEYCQVGCGTKRDGNGLWTWCDDNVCGYWYMVANSGEGYSQVCLVSSGSIDNSCTSRTDSYFCRKSNGCTGKANPCNCGNDKCPAGGTEGSNCLVVRVKGTCDVFKDYGKWTAEEQCVQCDENKKVKLYADTSGSYVTSDNNAPTLTCDGTPHECSAHNGNEDACKAAGCTYYKDYGTCMGTHKECKWFYTESDCKSHGCDYTPAKCERACSEIVGECDEKIPGDKICEDTKSKYCGDDCTYHEIDCANLGYQCDSDRSSSTFGECYTSCSNDNQCAANYFCDPDSSKCVKCDATTHVEKVFNCHELSESGCNQISGCDACKDFNGIFGECCNSGETCDKHMAECSSSSTTIGTCESDDINNVRGSNCNAGSGCDEKLPNTEWKLSNGQIVKCTSTCAYEGPPPVNTGLGTPEIVPSAPEENTEFKVYCPTNGNQQYNCIDAYSNEENTADKCSFIGWEGNKAVFNCNGKASGSYNAVCKTRYEPEKGNCAQAKTTKSYEVIPKAIEIVCGQTLGCTRDGNCNVENEELLFKYTLNGPTEVKISIKQFSNEVDWDLYADYGGEIPKISDTEDCKSGKNQRIDYHEIDSCEATIQPKTYYIKAYRYKEPPPVDGGNWNFDIKLECTQIPEYSINVGESLTKNDKKAYFKFTLDSQADIVVRLKPKTGNYYLYTKWIQDVRPLAEDAGDYKDDYDCISATNYYDEEICPENGQSRRLNPGTYYFMVNNLDSTGEYEVKVFKSYCRDKSCQYDTIIEGLDFVNGPHFSTENSDCYYTIWGEECRRGAEATDVNQDSNGKDYLEKGTCTDYYGCGKGECFSKNYIEKCACLPRCVEIFGKEGCDIFSIVKCALTDRSKCELNPDCFWALTESYVENDVCKEGYIDCKKVYGSNYFCSDGACSFTETTTTTTLPPNCPSDSCQTLLELIENSFGSVCGDSNYNKIADVNKDKKVDLFDMSGVSARCDSGEVWCQQKLDDTLDPCQECYSFANACNINCEQTLTDKSTKTMQYYKFTLKSTKDVTIKIVPDDYADYDLFVAWDGTEPNENQPIDDNHCKSENIGKDDECSKTGLTAGTYYAMVKYYPGNGNYDISLTCGGGQTTTTTTTTTTIPTDFIGNSFVCTSIPDGYNCKLDYTNNLDEDVIVYFLYTDEKGNVFHNSTMTAYQKYSSYVQSKIYCSKIGPGTYYVDWMAFRESDTDLSDAIAWSTSSETITC